MSKPAEAVKAATEAVTEVVSEIPKVIEGKPGAGDKLLMIGGAILLAGLIAYFAFGIGREEPAHA